MLNPPLPNSITIYGSGDDADPAVLPAFRACCHNAARAIGARVQSVVDPGYPYSYLEAVLVHPRRGTMSLLANRYHPIVGVAAVEPKWGREFLDAPDLLDAVVLYGGYEVADAATLQGPISAEWTELLGRDELRYIRYWRVTRVGDVIFNQWD